MIDFALHALEIHPEIAIFLAIALGTWVGRIHIGPFHLGAVAGSLLMGLVIGQVGVEVPALLKSVFFALFIYSVGFKSGPEFFGSLNRGTFKLVAFSVFLCVVALACVLGMNWAFGFDKGFAAGMGAGALTDTAILGTASSALNALPLSKEEIANLNSHMAVSYAITYLFGTVGLILFVGNIAPRLLGIDIKASARELEAQLAGGSAPARPDQVSLYTRLVVRAHRIEPGRPALGMQVEALEAQHVGLSIERVLRDGQVIERDLSLVLAAGDIVGVASRRDAVGDMGQLFGPEVDAPLALSYPAKTAVVVLTQPELAGRSLGEIRTLVGHAGRHGVFLVRVLRQGLALPLLDGTVFRRGDLLHLTGRPEQVDAFAARTGRVVEAHYKSDLAFHTLGIVAGSLLGLVSAHVGMIPVELGVGGGVLVVGLALGWFHSRHPAIGGLPAPAQWAFSEFGLTAFAAVVGLLAGPKAIHAIAEHGAALLLAGAFVTIVPPLLSLYFGRYVLKLHPMVLLGALAGAQTEAASMSAILEESQSQTPVLGFTVCYAVSNVLLAVWGPIIVALA